MFWFITILLLALIVLWPRRVVHIRLDNHIRVSTPVPRLPAKEPEPDLRCVWSNANEMTRMHRCEHCAGEITDQLYHKSVRPYERLCPVLRMRHPKEM